MVFPSFSNAKLPAAGILLSLMLAAPTGTMLHAQTAPRVQQSASGRSITLKQLLERGLRARRPEEFAFVNRVVRLVQQQRLSEKLVKSTYNWARKKRPYPFPYFERALKVQAAKQGIRI